MIRLSIGHIYALPQFSNFEEYQFFFTYSDIPSYSLKHITRNKKLLVVLLCLMNLKYFSVKWGDG